MNRLTSRSLALVGTLAVVISALAGSTVLRWAFQVALAVGALSILAGTRKFGCVRRGPWYGFAISVSIFFVSYGLRLLIPAMQPQLSGAPTAADYIDTLGFLAAIVAGHRLGQVRDKDKDPTTVIDALILTGGVSAVVWIYVMLPYIQNGALPLDARLLGLGTGALSLWLVFSGVRLAIGPSVKNPTSRYLAISTVCAMVAEIATSAGQQAEGDVVVAFGALCMIYLSSAALHPAMVQITEPASHGIGRMTLRRLVFMTLAVLVAPLVLLVKVSSNGIDFGFYSGLIISWIVVTVLVMIRLVGLVRARERVATVERSLSRAAASLVTATTSDETYASALVAMTELAGMQTDGLRASVALSQEKHWSIVGSKGQGSELASGRILDALLMESMLPVDSTTPIRMDSTLAFDNPHTGPCSMVAAPLISHGHLRGALLLSTARPVPSVVVEALEALAADVSLAVEAIVLTEDLHRRRSEQRLRALIEHSADLIFIFDAEENVIPESPAATRLLAENTHTLSTLISLVHPDDLNVVKRLLRNATPYGQPAQSIEFRLTAPTGRVGWFEATATDLSTNPEIAGVVLNARDITERREAEKERDLRDAHFRSLVQHSSDLTAVLDRDGLISYVSPSAESMLGVTPESLLGTELSALLHPEDRSVIEELAGMLVSGNAAPKQMELRVVSTLDRWKTFEVTLTDLRHDASVDGIVVNAHDITDRKALEHDLRHKVLHDDLTGIANRVLFRDRVDHALRSRRDGAATATAVLFIDVDDFKTVNDGLGHDIGDELLKVIAFRLESFVRLGDTAARLGGDEFAILLEDLYTIEDVLNASRRLLEILNQPIEFGRREINISASIGVALAEDDVTSDVLLRNADVAMYHAKQTGKNRVKLFDQAMYVSAFERLELKGDLVHALERNELSLHYQPLIRMSTGELIGFEALMRWVHPTRGFVSPASFIPLAEETGIIVQIGAWALNEALSQLAIWRERYQVDVGMSVNVSPRQLEEDLIVETVERAITSTGVDPSWVTLELTESSGLDDGASRDRLIALRHLGCEIAADDFGTGFASYAALQQLPFTNVKIDRSLITGLSAGDSRAQAQVKSIIQMGHALSLTITAEGIEDSRQADALVVMGADKGQGYLFGRPAPAAEAEERFREVKSLQK